MTRQDELRKMVAEAGDTHLAMSNAGYGVIYALPVENADSAVAVPARDKNMGWHKANPEIYTALVERFNAFPTLATDLAAALDEIARLRRICGEVRLVIDTGFQEMGETVNYSHGTIEDVCDTLERAALAPAASPEVVATMPGAQAMVAAAYLAAATAIKPVDVYGDGRYFRIHGFHEEGCAYKDDDLILAVSGLTSRILDLTPADAKAALDRLIAEAVAAEFSALQDPLVVHLNMVAGRIAKPLPSQLVHIYGEAEITAAIRGDRA